MQRFQRKVLLKRSLGEVAEWSIAAVLKTVVLRGTRGSNPCLSAIKGVNQVITRFTPFFTPQIKLSRSIKISKIAKRVAPYLNKLNENTYSDMHEAPGKLPRRRH